MYAFYILSLTEITCRLTSKYIVTKLLQNVEMCTELGSFTYKVLLVAECSTNLTWHFCVVHYYEVLIYMPCLCMGIKVPIQRITALEKC